MHGECGAPTSKHVSLLPSPKHGSIGDASTTSPDASKSLDASGAGAVLPPHPSARHDNPATRSQQVMKITGGSDMSTRSCIVVQWRGCCLRTSCTRGRCSTSLQRRWAPPPILQPRSFAGSARRSGDGLRRRRADVDSKANSKLRELSRRVIDDHGELAGGWLWAVELNENRSTGGLRVAT
jgi:hypothetical protein